MEDIHVLTPKRPQGKAWLLTYKGWLDLKRLVVMLERKTKPLAMWAAAHETGESGYKHTHVFLWMTKILRPTNARWADYGEVHPNIALVKNNKKNRDRVIKYVLKDEPNADHKYCSVSVEDDQADVLERIEASENKAEAIKEVCANGNYKTALAVSTLYDIIGGSKPRKRVDLDLRPWQNEIVEIVKTKPDDRHVYWVTDIKGGAGKTKLGKFMKSEGLSYTIKTSNCKDGALQLKKLVDKEGERRAVIFDFPRQFEERGSFYTLIEGIKDGEISSDKYDSELVEFYEDIHVIVFANFWPDVHKMSLDRWRIYEIVENELVKRSVDEVIRFNTETIDDEY